ncbi:MAG: hypothetical protein R3A45_13080 [Bdellovibrionota bacterium]
MSLHVKCEEEVDINEVREILSNAPGVKLIDAPEQNVYPILTDCQGQMMSMLGVFDRIWMHIVFIYGSLQIMSEKALRSTPDFRARDYAAMVWLLWCHRSFSCGLKTNNTL